MRRKIRRHLFLVFPSRVPEPMILLCRDLFRRDGGDTRAAASASTTSPMCSGARTVTAPSARATSKTFSFGTSSAVRTDTTGARRPRSAPSPSPSAPGGRTPCGHRPRPARRCFRARTQPRRPRAPPSAGSPSGSRYTSDSAYSLRSLLYRKGDCLRPGRDLLPPQDELLHLTGVSTRRGTRRRSLPPA